MKRKFIAICALTAILIFSIMVWMAGSILSASANQPIGSPPAEFAVNPSSFRAHQVQQFTDGLFRVIEVVE
jgi:hypothetical protein